jgi:SpoVK/Ycf46/Vps4 family AAA+-type ATPase
MASLWGEAEKNIGAVFEQANEYDKCIIFIDEIDVLAPSREGDESRHTKGVLTTMLTYLNGFSASVKEGQQRIFVAATNRPWALDSALLRGARLETQIYVPVPDDDARYYIIERAFGKDEKVKNRIDVPCADDVDFDWLADETKGMSVADIQAACRQIINRPLLRELEALEKGQIIPDNVTVADCKAVLTGGYLHGITKKSLLQFKAYSMRISVDELNRRIERQVVESAEYKKVIEKAESIGEYKVRELINNITNKIIDALLEEPI